ncbi:hypothetical protein AB4Z54_31910, partial [Streptomyces sp. MCAF7]
MPGSPTALRDSHRGEVERLLARAVEEEVRRSGGRTDGGVLLGRARAALDSMAATAAEEYGAYLRALEESEAESRPLSSRLTRRQLGPPMLATAVAAAGAFGADLSWGTSATTALGAGVTAALAGSAAAVVGLTAGHWPA